MRDEERFKRLYMQELTSQTPWEYLAENGTAGYERVFRCKKGHTYIDTCIRNEFVCTEPRKSDGI